MHLGLWLCVLTALGGSNVTSLSLGNFFSSSAMSISFAGGWIAIIAFFFNALAGSFFLCVVVERAKKCLDFTATAHLLHLCFCFMYDGFPASWEWCACRHAHASVWCWCVVLVCGAGAWCVVRGAWCVVRVLVRVRVRVVLVQVQVVWCWCWCWC